MNSLIPNTESQAAKAIQEMIEPLFPKSGYGPGKPFVSHYLVVYKNLNGLKQYLSKPETVAQRVQGVVKPHKLSLMHLATMTQQKEIAEFLVDKVDINARDASGWTPLHFAAFVNNPTIQKLLEIHGAKEEAYPGVPSPEDISRMVYGRRKPEEQIFFYEENGLEKKGDGTDFCRLTGAETFLDEEVTIAPAWMLHTWSQHQQLAIESAKIQLAYLSLRESGPSQNVRLVPHQGVGFEVVTRKPFQKGQMICEYLGKEDLPKPEVEMVSFFTDDRGDYTYEESDARFHRGLGAMINDGIPNCAPVTFHHLLGKSREIFIANEDLPAGTVLRWDYGTAHRVKFGIHSETDVIKSLDTYRLLRQKGRLDQLAKDSMAGLQAAGRGKKSKGEAVLNSVDQLATYQKLLYLSGTPSLMAILVTHQVISAQEIDQLSQVIPDIYPQQTQIIREFIWQLKKILPKDLDTLSPESKKAIIEVAQTSHFNDILRYLKGVFPTAFIQGLQFRDAKNIDQKVKLA